MKSKKSTISVDMMIWMALGLVVFLVLVFTVPRLLGQGGKETCKLLTSSRDYDRDGISDFFDKCPCNEGEEDYDGCPKTGTIMDEKTCKAKIQEDCEKT